MSNIPSSKGALYHIRYLRHEYDLTRTDLARIARVTKETIKKLENGQTEKPHMQTLHNIARALGVPISDIWGGEESR